MRLQVSYDVTVPRRVRGILASFEGRSTGAHAGTLLGAGVGWVAGYGATGGGGRLLALAAGSTVCGLVLGVAFTRALGGPALNLVASLVWPVLLGGVVALAGGLPVAWLYSLGVGVALVFPAFFAAFGCLLAWFAVLGPERIDRWTRRTHPDAFFEEA